MSLEQKIEALTAQVAALTESNVAMIPLVQQWVANQERVLAVQQKAVEVVEGGKEKATGTRRTRAAKEPEKTDTPNTSDEPADTASGAGDAGSASEAGDAGSASEEAAKLDFKTYAQGWLNSQEKGSDEYKRRGKLLMGILGNFGAGKISELDAEHHDKATFFIKRDEAGKPVDFEADYDFTGDPAQEVEADMDGAFD